MYLRICPIICCAILVGFATAAQSGSQRNSDITFDDDHLEGSGNNGEVSQDLAESSGSGFGPDDEDTPSPGVETRINQTPHQPPPVVQIPELTGPNQGDTVDQSINKTPVPSSTETDSVIIMNPKSEDRHTPFFAQPGILAAVIGGAVVGLLCAILVVMFIVYRMRKKDEGSYALGEPKQSPNATSYSRGNSKEFYA